MRREIYFKEDARNKVKAGVNLIGDAVSVTLGPKGRNVMIGKEYQLPHITKDGVTVARNVESEDIFEDMGTKAILEVAAKTMYNAGDGTTTGTVLAQAMYNIGFKNIVAGANPMDIKRGMEMATEIIVKKLKRLSTEVDSPEKIAQVGTVSANGDAFIGGLIAEAMDKVGKDGIITVEESQGTETEVRIVEGMKLGRGFISPKFITNQSKLTCELSNPVIMLYDQKISELSSIENILEGCLKKNRAILFICEDVEGEALSALVINKEKAGLKCAAINTPGLGSRKDEILSDVAAITGGKVISHDSGLNLEDVEEEHLGSAKKVVISPDGTQIIGGRADEEALIQAKEGLSKMIEDSKEKDHQEWYKQRLAGLAGGVAILSVGASSEIEMTEKKDRIDDALHATRCAVEEGIVPGGGVALMKCIEVVEAIEIDNKDQMTGVSIIRQAMEAPIRTIVANCGSLENTPDVVVNRVRKGKKGFGYNAREDRFENLLESGVIDPAKVTRCAIENATSVVSLLLTTECGIAYKRQENN